MQCLDSSSDHRHQRLVADDDNDDADERILSVHVVMILYTISPIISNVMDVNKRFIKNVPVLQTMCSLFLLAS